MAAACGPARGLSVPPPHWGSEASTANVRPRRGQQEQWTPRAQVTMPAPLLWASARDRGQPSCVVRDSLSPLKTPGVTQLLSPVPTPRVWPSRPQEPTQYQESQRAPDVDSLSDGRELADGRPSAQCRARQQLPTPALWGAGGPAGPAPARDTGALGNCGETKLRSFILLQKILELHSFPSCGLSMTSLL